MGSNAGSNNQARVWQRAKAPWCSICIGNRPKIDNKRKEEGGKRKEEVKAERKQEGLLFNQEKDKFIKE